MLGAVVMGVQSEQEGAKHTPLGGSVVEHPGEGVMCVE